MNASSGTLKKDDQRTSDEGTALGGTDLLFGDGAPYADYGIVVEGEECLVPIPAYFGDALLNTFYFDLFHAGDDIRGNWTQV